MRAIAIVCVLLFACECSAQCRSFGCGFSSRAVFVQDFGFPATVQSFDVVQPALAFDAFGNVRTVGFQQNLPIVIPQQRFFVGNNFVNFNRVGVFDVRRRFAPIRNAVRFLGGRPPLLRSRFIGF